MLRFPKLFHRSPNPLAPAARDLPQAVEPLRWMALAEQSWGPRRKKL